MDSGGHYYWYPHYITTIVIAVDTGKVKENINSFNSLAGVEEKIYIDSDYYNYITASIGYSLKKENYRLDDAINYLKEMADSATAILNFQYGSAPIHRLLN